VSVRKNLVSLPPAQTILASYIARPAPSRALILHISRRILVFLFLVLGERIELGYFIELLDFGLRRDLARQDVFFVSFL
jgi:hypothetical protein